MKDSLKLDLTVFNTLLAVLLTSLITLHIFIKYKYVGHNINSEEINLDRSKENNLPIGVTEIINDEDYN